VRLVRAESMQCGTGGNVSMDNCSVISDGDSDDPEPYYYRTEQLVTLYTLLFVIIMGNVVVILSLGCIRRRKSRMNFFILHLAFADLSVGLFSVVPDIAWKFAVSWEAGLLACKLIKFCQLVVTYGSTYVLVALSVDRYDAITHPMRFNRSYNRAKWLVLSAWLTSIVFSVPILFFFDLHETKDYGTQCWIDFTEAWQWQVYMSLVSLSIFIVPAVIIAVCYTTITVTIWRRGRIMQPPLVTYAILPRVPLTEARRQRIALDDAENRRTSSRGLIPKAKVKTIKMTFVIIFVFVICWSPYIVFDLLQVFGLLPQAQSNATIAAATFIQSLAPLNSAANPIIYCLFSADAGKLLRPCYKVLPCLRVHSGAEPGVTSSGSGQTNSSLLTTSSGSSQLRRQSAGQALTHPQLHSQLSHQSRHLVL